MAKIRVPQITSLKGQRQIKALTAYDYTFAKLLNQAEIDIVLVGDSLSNVVQGKKNTINVTMDQMVYHTACVAKACKYSLAVSDMPFMSYQISNEQALENATRLFQEGQAEAVKLEGGEHIAERIETLVRYDLPVMGHIGLTPQSYHNLGGHKRQGEDKSIKNSNQIIKDAKAVANAGAFAVVLECIPDDLAKEITETINIPTIGIGSGKHCDGQIAVTHDVLGFNKAPGFITPEENLSEVIIGAVKRYFK